VKQEQQVPRNALVWIILSLFTLVAPHTGRLPVWVLLIYVIAAVWRFQVYKGRWSFPGLWVKVSLIIGGFVGVYFSYNSLVELEPTVALLLTACALKLIELVQRKDAYVLLFRKDAYVLLFLGYFICITEFLFSQDLLIVLYTLFNVVVVTTALVALHRPGEHQFNRKPFRLAGIMVLQALPLMLVLFFLFPRIGPLWTVPLKSSSAKSGMSDFMKPGDVSRLTQSGDVAFRVQFEGDIPPASELYWRGLVFSKLQDGAWRSLQYYDIPATQRRQPAVAISGEPLRYQVIMEPTQQHWLYSLRYARRQTPGVMLSADYRLYRPVEVEDEYLYRVASWPAAPLEQELSDWRRKTELKLPPRGNPQTRQLARQLRGRAGSDQAMVDAVLDLFNTQPFIYTLQPPLLAQEHPMDQFLFQSRRGFCEHYAYAFVVLMRAAGVPARVVAGYQGGEINPVNKTVIVHQFDAHAWAEVWLQGQGWVRVDPTAAVSPARIEWGLEQAMAEEGTFLAGSPFSPLRYRSVVWINLMRLRYDALTYRWQSWVVGFNQEKQFDLLHDVFGQASAAKYAAVFLGSWVLVLVPVAVSLLLKRKTHRLSCGRMARLGVARVTGETPRDFAARARVQLPVLEPRIEQVTDLYMQMAYVDNKLVGERERDLLGQLSRAVKSVR
jgi:transglutaminase-like putative cysteine protease